MSEDAQIHREVLSGSDAPFRAWTLARALSSALGLGPPEQVRLWRALLPLGPAPLELSVEVAGGTLEVRSPVGSRFRSPLPATVTAASLAAALERRAGGATEDEVRLLVGLVAEGDDRLLAAQRGLVSLQEELDAKTEALWQMGESRARFVSNASHELRTPLNSILGLSRILLDRTDGDLTLEQEKQVRFVRNAAESLRELVDDLLELARLDAGKVTIRASEFTLEGLFSAVRGIVRPLVHKDQIDLTFVVPPGMPTVYGDEAKISQVLRSLLANALKFTHRGEIEVRAALLPDDRLALSVRDTGVGIPPEEQLRIFDEFHQLEGPLQGRAKGAGLGLPHSRRLAHLLGGTLEVVSAPGPGRDVHAEDPPRASAHGRGERLGVFIRLAPTWSRC